MGCPDPERFLVLPDDDGVALARTDDDDMHWDLHKLQRDLFAPEDPTAVPAAVSLPLGHGHAYAHTDSEDSSSPSGSAASSAWTTPSTDGMRDAALPPSSPVPQVLWHPSYAFFPIGPLLSSWEPVLDHAGCPPDSALSLSPSSAPAPVVDAATRPRKAPSRRKQSGQRQEVDPSLILDDNDSTLR